MSESSSSYQPGPGDQLMSLAMGLIEGRNQFFGRALGQIRYATRDSILTRFLVNEMMFLQIGARLYHDSTAQPSTITFTIPDGFMNPVNVRPTDAEIEAALENITESSSNCAICQEPISSGGARIRYCNHVYHRSCLTTWFLTSVRCPVCRHDIREANPASRTQPAEE